MSGADEVPGPVDVVVIELPEAAATDGAGRALHALLDAGTISLFDIAMVAKAGDGSVRRLDLSHPDHPGARSFAPFAGAQSDLFDDGDLAQAAGALEPGTVGLLVAFENTWVRPFVGAAHAAGGQVVASQRIPAEVLIEVLDLAEPVG
ncbi:DUF6325 family protein [Iamia majanohamensis]|uniref:DUF6325 family protein n=1 Tax=Iamia majanohamensis TaxID=467976 RepID=A0AAE9Y9G1_9ACTN|nr:DUF6325 family protein [Iamia majanohamensis]WCO66794.1 DUF6325 family protein [Iamia majanohamensis]